jgi:hypothetical protein
MVSPQDEQTGEREKEEHSDGAHNNHRHHL